MIRVADTHIQVNLVCDACGHEWDVEDYDSPDTASAVAKLEALAAEAGCPSCGAPANDDENFCGKCDAAIDAHPGERPCGGDRPGICGYCGEVTEEGFSDPNDPAGHGVVCLDCRADGEDA